MTQNKAILVATIGTRDVAFYTESEGKWLNIGNAYSSTLEESHLVKIQYDLNIEDDNANFRNITEYLSNNYQEYQDKLIPIIIGKLIKDKKDIIKTIYLVVTNQKGFANAKFCEKDTLYSGKIIKKYLESHYNFDVKIFYQGNEEKSNPANFEQMFTWWQKFWDIIDPDKKNNQDLLLCLKGGVNQSSEAARITSIIRFEENVTFYDFEEKEILNCGGKPSPYFAPFKGINYLWSRKQAEALSLLERYDYEAVDTILTPYYRDSNNEDIRKLKLWLSKAIKWNITDFDTFINGLQKIPENNWWWKGYESAYLGLVRFKQGNNIEAFFHGFRGIEGLMSELISVKYKDYVITPKGETPYLKLTICDQNSPYSEFKNSKHLFKNGKVFLYGAGLDSLTEIALPNIKNTHQWKRFFIHIKPWRNRLYHRFKHLATGDLFNAWEVGNQKDWENKILYFLNFLSGQNYSSLEEASLMAEYHQKIKDLILTYHP